MKNSNIPGGFGKFNRKPVREKPQPDKNEQNKLHNKTTERQEAKQK